MNTTAGMLPAQVFESGLADLKRWRDATAESLGNFRRWAMMARLLDEQSAARLAHLERRLAAERLTIAFAGEFGRGKSELINALFFTDLGGRLLPGGARCPTEILWDPSQPPSIRLLPIETRATARALREYQKEMETWQQVPLDPANRDGLAAACAVLAETIDVEAGHAASLGFQGAGEGRVTLARWRYAVINLPHPLLAAGVGILDTADQRTLASEPELSFHRVPDSAAIVFTLSAAGSISDADLQLWNDHIATIGGIEHTCFVALNKIDELRGGGKSESQVLVDIDRQVRVAAEVLGVAPTRVFALSARQAYVSKVRSDRDGILKSRLYRLEQALARGMVHQRRVDHATAVRAEAHGVFAETRSLIESRLSFANEQLAELVALQDKNQKLVEAIARKAVVDRGRLDQARATLGGTRAAHNRHADELARLLDPQEARASGMRAQAAVSGSAFSKGIGEALDEFFGQSRQRITRAVEVIEEAKNLMAMVSRKFSDEYKVAAIEAAPFATGRFLAELDRLEEHSNRDFKGRSALLTRSRKTLGAQFFESVASQVIHVFEIADRETRTWMSGFIRPLEAQVNAYQEQSNARIEGMGRIQNAEVDLLARMDELKKVAAEAAAQREEWQGHYERVMSLIEVEREHSLA